MIGLTPRQRDALAAICAYQDEHRLSPSMREIARLSGVASQNTSRMMCLALEERGFIRRLPRRARAIEILRRPPPAPSGMSPGPDLTINGERWMTFRVEERA